MLVCLTCVCTIKQPTERLCQVTLVNQNQSEEAEVDAVGCGIRHARNRAKNSVGILN